MAKLKIKNPKRDFLWRRNNIPYNILIAEFMLQRTKAEQVEPVYRRFLKQFPDVFTLSKASLISVSKFTKSLGIHWRANHIVGAAKYIVENHNGEIPKSREELLKIPGVGDYIAGAIQAVCFNNAEYVIDSNIARFINRFYGLALKGELRRKKVIINYARNLFKMKHQRRQFFSILDFTAITCKPQKPQCGKCYLNKKCKMFAIQT